MNCLKKPSMLKGIAVQAANRNGDQNVSPLTRYACNRMGFGGITNPYYQKLPIMALISHKQMLFSSSCCSLGISLNLSQTASCPILHRTCTLLHKTQHIRRVNHSLL